MQVMLTQGRQYDAINTVVDHMQLVGKENKKHVFCSE